MTAVNFTKPVTSDTRANVLQYIRDYMDCQAKMFDGDTLTSTPTNAIRYSSANSRFEKWNGSAWAALTLGLLPLTGGTLSGGLTGTSGAFTSLTVGGNAVWHAGNLTPASYLALSGGTLSGVLNTVNVLPVANNVSVLGSDALRYAGVYATSFFEGGTALSSKYAIASHTHSYLPLTGGTLSGTLTGALGAFSSLTIGGNGVWHAGNFTPGAYSLTSHTHSYLPLSGGNITGALSRGSLNVVTASVGAPNISRGTTDPTGGNDGDFYAQYT